MALVDPGNRIFLISKIEQIQENLEEKLDGNMQH